MSQTIHKANYNDKVEVYMGFGQKEMQPTTVCRGGKGYYSKKPPRGRIARNWKHVTCKHCLKKRTPEKVDVTKDPDTLALIPDMVKRLTERRNQ